MAVDDPDVVDFIGIDRDSGIAILTISDHLEWDTENRHLLILQQKINRYLEFIESGELFERYPQAIDRKVRIDVVCKHPPTVTVERFLTTARGIIEQDGCSFSWRVPDSRAG